MLYLLVFSLKLCSNPPSPRKDAEQLHKKNTFPGLSSPTSIEFRSRLLRRSGIPQHTTPPGLLRVHLYLYVYKI